MHQLFLDTEFCKTRRGLELISLGAVLGNLELYVELDTASIALLPSRGLDSFVRTEVLPQLGLVEDAAGSVALMALRATSWLQELNLGRVEVIYDFSADFTLLERLLKLAPVPISVDLVPVNVAYLVEDADGERAAQACWDALIASRGLRRHHSLADAHALRARFEAVHNIPGSAR